MLDDKLYLENGFYGGRETYHCAYTANPLTLNLKGTKIYAYRNAQTYSSRVKLLNAGKIHILSIYPYSIIPRNMLVT